MNWLLWILAFYLGIGLLIAGRLHYVLVKLSRELAVRAIAIRKRNFIKTVIFDGLSWPYYVLWYGLKDFFQDIK
jgi:hypothetical protein